MHASTSSAASSAFPAPIPPAANLLPPAPFAFGQAVFEARRAAWLAQPAPASADPAAPSSSTSTSTSAGSAKQRPAPPPSAAAAPAASGAEASLRRLEDLLALCDAGEGDDVPQKLWKAGLENVHRGLIGGRKLAKPMPLALTIKILRAGWLRDGTWPRNLPPVADSPPFVPADLPTASAADDPLRGAASDDVSVLLDPQADDRAAVPSRPARLGEVSAGGAEGGAREEFVEEGSGSISDTEGQGPAGGLGLHTGGI